VRLPHDLSSAEGRTGSRSTCVQQLTLAGLHPPLHDRVRPRHPDPVEYNVDASSARMASNRPGNFPSRSRAASNARSPGVNRTLSGPSCRCRTESCVAQRQDLRVFVPAAHRQQPQQHEHVRHTERGQLQQHGRSPCNSVPCSTSAPAAATAHNIGLTHAPAPTSTDEVFGRSRGIAPRRPGPFTGPRPANCGPGRSRPAPWARSGSGLALRRDDRCHSRDRPTRRRLRAAGR
jgi:hypothetical protein